MKVHRVLTHTLGGWIHNSPDEALAPHKSAPKTLASNIHTFICPTTFIVDLTVPDNANVFREGCLVC